MKIKTRENDIIMNERGTLACHTVQVNGRLNYRFNPCGPTDEVRIYICTRCNSVHLYTSIVKPCVRIDDVCGLTIAGKHKNETIKNSFGGLGGCSTKRLYHKKFPTIRYYIYM